MRQRLLLLLSLAVFLFVPAALVAQSITITPGYTNIGVGTTLQYHASTTGLTNESVTWSVSGKPATSGTITSTGLYTAPATVPTVGVTITALGSDKKTSCTVYVNVEPAGPTITSISPNPLSTGDYTMTLTGSNFQTGAFGLVGPVRYTATYVNSTTLKVTGSQGTTGQVPVQVNSPGTLYGTPFMVTFTAPTKPPTPQTISPSSANVNLGATQQFTSGGATSWSATAGVISPTGLYSAPAAMPASNKVTVTATGPNGSASSTVTLVNPVTQVIAPTSVSLALGATQQFTSAGATTWAATAGTIDATGLYTAPAVLPTSSNVKITVTGPNGTTTAAVTLIPPQPVITAVNGGALPLGIFSTSIAGNGFTVQSVASLNGKALATAFSNGGLTISGFYGQSGMVNLTVANGALVSAPFPVQVGVQNALASAAAARRFLEQAAFGPTPNDAAHVQAIGMKAWINEQFAMPQISNYDIILSSQGGMPQHFLTNAVTDQDQLRQRVGLALSEIFVTSISKLIWNDNMVPYQNMLLADSFTNYRKIMLDVTLSPAMGQYLDMGNNAKANPATGSLANENYARELMQLFTTGDVLLHQDGTPILDSNNLPTATYTQATIAEFARVYTGWTYAPYAGQSIQWNHYINGGNMVPYPPQHDMGAKTLLNGYVSPAAATPLQDLNNALDNIFNHPNVGPFVGTQLIQHLVKSNPSPAYVSRVAAAFNDNGQGVRGDMQAVITAILLDPEARANDEGGNDMPTDGHLQEPALFIPAMVRAFGGQMNDQNYYQGELIALGQDMFDSPSVFNYFSPSYLVPGTTLTGGEFQIDGPNNSIVRANEAAYLMYTSWTNPVQTLGPGTSIDLTPFVALAATPSTLVDAMDLTLTHGVMPAAMKQKIVTAVGQDTYGSLHQVQTAAYLILSSYYYNVWH